MTERKKNLLIWTLLIIASAVSAWFIVAGKMAYMEREFVDFGAAKAAGEFEKGWLPGFLPSSATAIKAVNDTDNESAVVSFSYAGDLDMSGCKELSLLEATVPAESTMSNSGPNQSLIALASCPEDTIPAQPAAFADFAL